jgi:hypothetical protein
MHALVGGVSSLTTIAQHLEGGIALKHRIKSVDRLLGHHLVHRHFLQRLAQIVPPEYWGERQTAAIGMSFHRHRTYRAP